MSEINRKRKATDQLSPYSKDLTDEQQPIEKEQIEVKDPNVVFKKARVRKDLTVSSGASLKGIFGNVSLTAETPKEPIKKVSTKRDELIAGLNTSLLRSVEKIVKRQSTKDLTYILEQYAKFLKEIETNNKC